MNISESSAYPGHPASKDHDPQRMNLIFFTHPAFIVTQSMPRFARMLSEGMGARGHQVEIWTPRARFYQLPLPRSLKKWAGYLDQFLIFPLQVRKRIRNIGKNTLFVFTDHALGPWIPLVARRPHVIHCHDFLAVRSALGEISENPTSWSGRVYQRLIRNGFSQATNFISVSLKTREDLHTLLPAHATRSEVVYNGLNQSFATCEPAEARRKFSEATGLNIDQGYILHVGGNQWYKNRLGVISIFDSLRSSGGPPIKLILIGAQPSQKLQLAANASPFQNDICFLSGLEDEVVRLAYAGASVFLFPSLAEGFGWPIAEAMAAGCPVVTTNEAPMIEVAGGAAFLIPRRPADPAASAAWSAQAAETVSKVLHLTPIERETATNAGRENAAIFEPSRSLDLIESIYRDILAPSNDHEYPQGHR